MTLISSNCTYFVSIPKKASVQAHQQTFDYQNSAPVCIRTEYWIFKCQQIYEFCHVEYVDCEFFLKTDQIRIEKREPSFPNTNYTQEQEKKANKPMF